MLEKTMKQVINKKVNQWIDSIDNKEIKNIIKDNLVITGGCFTSMILNEAPKDFDCYFKTKESALRIAQYYADLWNKSEKYAKRVDIKVLDKEGNFISSDSDFDRIKIYIESSGVAGDPEEVKADEELGTEEGFVSSLESIQEIDEVAEEEIDKQEKKDYFPVFFSSNAITLSRGIQIVTRFYGNPEEVHDTFDFIHTRGYWTKETGIVISKEVYEATINKTLKYTGSRYPVCSVFRLRKFLSRGWKINAGELLKICLQISELNLFDINVLSEQLIGVDSSYFMALIDQFRKMKEKDPNFNLTTNYVMSIVDKIF